MALLRIENYKNFWIEKDQNIDKYLTEGFFDIDSPKFKKANKTPLKDFTLVVRVSKVVDGKQKFKKKKFVFTKAKDDLTILKALDQLANVPEELLSQIRSDAEIQKEVEAETLKQKERDQLKKSNRVLNDVWDDFYQSKTTGARTDKWRESTANNYKSFYNVWIRETDLGNKTVKEITKNDCIDLIDIVHEGRSLRTATTAIEIMRPLFDWYFDENDIDKRNPVPSKKNYKLSGEQDNKRIVDVPLSQIRKLYKAFDSYEDDTFKKVFIWLRTGRRRGEVVSLSLDDINTVKKHFTIQAKNNKAKVQMQYKLRPELEENLPPFNIHPDSISKHWKKIKEKVGGVFELNHKEVPFTDLHLHDIRHIINGVMKRAEVPQETREKVLGHKNASINERYGVAYYGDADKAFQLFIDIVYGVVPDGTKWGDV